MAGEGAEEETDISRKEVQAVHFVILGLIKYSQGKTNKLATLESFLGVFFGIGPWQDEVTCSVLA